MPNDMKERIVRYLAKWRGEGAMWTSDIALGAFGRKGDTTKVRRALTALVAEGKVVRIVTGSPSSWKLKDAEEVPQ